MLLQLRGTCCSGKSSVARAILTEVGVRNVVTVPPGHPFARNKVKPTHLGYRCRGDLLVLGRYPDVGSAGGVEGPPQAYIRNLVRTAATHYPHVFFEGYMCSFPGKPWLAVYESLVGDGHVAATENHVATMSTPYETCLARLAERTPDHALNEPVQRSFFASLHGRTMPLLQSRPDLVTAYWVDHENAVDALLGTLRAAGWRP